VQQKAQGLLRALVEPIIIGLSGAAGYEEPKTTIDLEKNIWGDKKLDRYTTLHATWQSGHSITAAD